MASSIAPVHAEPEIGIVLLHGKGGVPMGDSVGRGSVVGGRLVVLLRAAGYRVATPELCWSRQRAFDRPYSDCLRDIDTAIADLKSHGATSIVVGGLSLGGNAAIAYGATHPGLLGIIAMAPADDPTRKAARYPSFTASVTRAHDLMAQGKGDERTHFADTNTGAQGSFATSIEMTPRIFLSFSEQGSLADIPANVAKLTMPLLWVAGDNDPTQRGGRGFAFDKAPPNNLDRYVTVSANHLETPDAGADAILEWLKTLPAK
jgi:pimeloyl-ACP methyl ester carboxylesterase